MKLPNCLKNLNSRKGNEKGSVTLFVLIAMLFFLMIGMMIFIINMNTETSQKRDVEKIKSEYNANTSETDLEQLYQEAKQRQIGTFMIKLIDKYGTIYNSGEWVNENWLAEGRLPLTVQPNFPEGLKDISVTVKDDTYGGSTIITKTADLATMEIRADKDCQYTIENTLDNTNQVKINIDTTKPTIDELKGGTIWKGTEEEEITGTDAGGAITITARDNLSGVKELKYIINNSPEAPSADAEWTTAEGATAQVTINNENDLGVYYIHAMATDVAGNVRDVVTSGPYEVKQANYKITTTTGTTYSETLKDAAEKPGAMVIKVLNTFTDEVPATIAQNVTIDTNGKTLTMAETITVASGATATFVDAAETKGKLERTTGGIISNSGKVIVDGATIEGKDIVINGGNVEVKSGIVDCKGSANRQDTKTISADNIKISGGTITNNYSTDSYHIIDVKQKLEIIGGTLNGGNYGIVPLKDAEVIISGGTINSDQYAIGSVHANTNIVIKSGNIVGNLNALFFSGENTNITIGDNANALNKELPVIQGKTKSSLNITGTGSTLNFYDGKIIGKNKGTKTFNGREVAFNVANDTTVNFLTETEEGNVTRYYRPYTRQNEETHLFETVLEKQVNVTFNPGEGATVAESNRNVLTNVEYKEKADTAEIASLPTPEKTGYTFKGWNGKNLFSGLEKGKQLNNDTGTEVNSTKGSVSDFIPVDFTLNNTYYLSGLTNTLYSYVAAYNKNKEFIGRTGGSAREKKPFSNNSFNMMKQDLEDKEIKYIRVTQYVSSLSTSQTIDAIDGLNIQFEVGGTATAYEPYLVTAETKVTTASDHTLKAVWETIPYTISYELNKGTNNSSNPTGYTIETENITLQNPTRNGYTFIGWTGSNGDTPQTTVTIPKGSTGNKTYTANWEEKTYTLTIKPNGGALDGSTTDVVRNLKYSDVSNINDPTRTGYSFGGYNELSGGVFNNGLASVEEYNNAHNGVVTVTTQAKSSDNPITGMSNEVKITNAGTEQTQPGLGGFLHTKHADANQKYVHVFVAKLPEGYYFHNANNKLGEGATTQWLTSNEGTGNWQTYVYQVNAGSSGTFENFGYVYVSADKDNDWRVHRAETGSYTAYLAYSNIYDITSDDSEIGQIDGTGVLTANWTATPYAVTLNAGDGTIDAGDDGWARAGDNKTATKDITYDSNYGTLPTASRTGYTFDGWYTDATNGTQITDVSIMQTASEQSLYAHWTANKYTVTAHANGGAIASTTGWEGTGESATKQVTYDSAYGTLPEVTKTGYTFKGWNGKNLFDEESILMAIEGATKENNHYKFNNGQSRVKYGGDRSLPIGGFKENTSYTMSIYGYISASYWHIRFDYIDGTTQYGVFNITEEGKYDISSNANKTLKSIKLSYGNGATVFISHIQLEEGTTATAYEPYLVTAETKVTTASDHKLKAVWETIPYTISYELNKGTNNSSNPTSYTIESENITLQNPTRNGYTFIGWTGSNGDTPQTTVTIPKGSTGNKTYTANWEEKTYTLTIKPNGGALDGSTTDVVRNLKYSDVSNINAPTRTGYTFGGYNELSGAAYNNGLASMEVYNNNNNGVVTVTSQAKSADNPISGMSNEVKITNAGTTETKPGLGGFIHRKTVTANGKYVHVFVAKLPEGYYFHNANNSLGTGATTQWLTSNEGTGKWQTYVYQVNAGSSGTFSSFGHVYVSTDKDNTWSVKPAETGAYTAYLAYSNIYDITSDDSGIGQIDGTGVLTAKWTATPYTVTLNAGDGTIDDGDDGWTRAGDNKTATKDITYDSNYGTLPTASRTGYTFDGWYTDATNGTKITDVSIMQTASEQSLYAHWTANNYTIHFDANGGTGEMTDLPMTYGTPANLTANAFSRTGYKFVKWTSNADGTGNEYIDGQTVNNLTEINNDTVNLFAQWEERPFVVTFNPNGGIVTPESKEITYNSTYGDLPSGDNIKRLGYTFAGWYKEAELTNEVTAETTYDITEDSTLYAKWTPHVYTVTFNKNGGTGTMSDQSFTYGQTQNLRANTFTRTGYTFAGWARAENGTIEFTNEQSISNLTPENGGTITLYAVWNDVTRPSWSVRLLDIINK